MRNRAILVVLSIIFLLGISACASQQSLMEPAIVEPEAQCELPMEVPATVETGPAVKSPVVSEPTPPESPQPDTGKAEDVLAIGWETTAELWWGMYGHRQTVSLPPGGVEMPCYGMGTFDMDSSIGTAAVWMDLLSYEEGGTVTIEIREGPEYTKGGDSYEGWNTVFVFIDNSGQEIVPEEGMVLTIPDIEETEWVPTEEQATYFTVYNDTGTTLTYLDIYTNDMFAVDSIGYNLLPEPLAPGTTFRINLSDHADLEEAILYRYGQLFHVIAENAYREVYYREWYPDFDSLDLHLTPAHLDQSWSEEALAPDTFRIENLTGYDILELYILTPEMEDELDFSMDLLDLGILESDGSITFHKDDIQYLQPFFSGERDDGLLVIAYDEDDYMLVTDWYPTYDPWIIQLTYEDYFDL